PPAVGAVLRHSGAGQAVKGSYDLRTLRTQLGRDLLGLETWLARKQFLDTFPETHTAIPTVTHPRKRAIRIMAHSPPCQALYPSLSLRWAIWPLAASLLMLDQTVANVACDLTVGAGWIPKGKVHPPFQVPIQLSRIGIGLWH